MRRLLPLGLVTLLLSGCATLWMDPIKRTGPDTYEITHTMYKYSPTKGVRQGVIDRAKAKCAGQNKPFSKLREEMTPGGTLSYTLTFSCNDDNPIGL